MLKKIITIIATTLAFTSGVAQAALVNVDYIVLDKPIPQLHKNKVEVLEFFSYSCIHCSHLEPYILKEMKSFAPDTYLRPVHVVWDDNVYYNLARIAAAVNSTGMKLNADPVIFDAIFTKHIELWQPDVFKKWAVQQTAFDGQKLVKAYNSQENSAIATDMRKLSEKYNIQATPIVIVGGKYQLQFPRGYQAGMVTLNELIEKVRNENGISVATTRKLPKSIGASLAASANR
ncbi:thiol:disulfide interchange protein DsbA/DsbL [Snodgrassella sp.]|uniref:thiol:disulfide interchange protein DsbA/DsbL n=1 Tax=Snodgrassella sp. TaxID=2815304 RepID=UPI0025832D10|nr:thiol:disulfide interchange protein DsbA/DsbL [Snodgrassella sp.]MCO6518796.1 thiol:disulfide interchange protein DsbA/DsbL [Snodgrassella sp.]